MTAVAFVPIVLSLLLLGAHFFRAGSPVLAAAAVLLVAALAIPRPWAARIVQAGLALGTVEWLRTTLVLTAERMHAGVAYQRMTLILGSVALMTLCSALLFQTRRLSTVYRLTGPDNDVTDPPIGRIPTEDDS